MVRSRCLCLCADINTITFALIQKLQISTVAEICCVSPLSKANAWKAHASHDWKSTSTWHARFSLHLRRKFSQYALCAAAWVVQQANVLQPPPHLAPYSCEASPSTEFRIWHARASVCSSFSISSWPSCGLWPNTTFPLELSNLVVDNAYSHAWQKFNIFEKVQALDVVWALRLTCTTEHHVTKHKYVTKHVLLWVTSQDKCVVLCIVPCAMNASKSICWHACNDALEREEITLASPSISSNAIPQSACKSTSHDVHGLGNLRRQH